MPSTVIGKIDYDPRSRRLTIDFVPSGRRYAYLDVPTDLADDFRHAFAKGSFFNRRIRDRYAAERVFDPAAAGDPSPAPLLRP